MCKLFILFFIFLYSFINVCFFAYFYSHLTGFGMLHFLLHMLSVMVFFVINYFVHHVFVSIICMGVHTVHRCLSIVVD